MLWVKKMWNNKRSILNIEWVCNSDLCHSCGTCQSICPKNAIRIIYKNNSLTPSIDRSKCITCGNCLKACPGREINIKYFAGRHQPDANDCFMIGRWRKIYSGYTLEDDLLIKSASGGLITASILFLLDNKLVDGAILCRMLYYPEKLSTEPYIAYTRDEVMQSQGSKYCPVSLNSILAEAVKTGKRFVFVGLPCHVHGLRNIQEMDSRYITAFPYVLGSFCGGVKDFSATYNLLRAYNLELETVKHISFRGNGWPGFLTIVTSSGQIIKKPYPEYGRDAWGAELNRCNFCIDGTSELADLSFGDAWLERYNQSLHGWSSVICRTQAGENLLEKMAQENKVYLEVISKEDLIKSQYQNLEKKKTRQAIRRLLHGFMKLPKDDGGFPKSYNMLFPELKFQIYSRVSKKIGKSNIVRNIYYMLKKLKG